MANLFSSVRKNLFHLPVLWALLYFLTLWRLDFPKPFVDDLFYTRAAVNLASGGDLSNPMLARHGFRTHYFFQYPPSQSYTLAGWVKVFGVSARSMTAFSALCYFVIAASIISLLRRYNAPKPIDWLVPFAVSASLFQYGFRPDALATALTMAGFALIPSGSKNRLFVFLGFLLMCVGASTAPRTTFFSVVLMALAASNLWQSAEKEQRNFWLWLAPIAAGLAAVFIFSAEIHFQFKEFWLAFREHSQLVGGPKLNSAILFFSSNPATQFPLLALLLGLLIFARPKMEPLTRICAAIGVGLPIVILTGGIGIGSLWYVILILVLLTAAVAKAQQAIAWKLQIVLAALLCLANVQTFFQAFGEITGRISHETGENTASVAAMVSTAEHPVLIDQTIARYVFDYRIPPGYLDIVFSSSFPKTWAVDDPKLNDTYVMGPQNLEVIKQLTTLNMRIPKWSPFALPNVSLDRFPRHVYVIPVEDCTVPRK